MTDDIGGREIARYFQRSEFACKCGCGYDTVDAELLDALRDIRQHFGAPVTITSGCRCPAHNKKVGGSPSSQHMLGRAADIKVAGVAPSEVAQYAKETGFLSVGEYSTFTHVDTRTNGPTYFKK